jgi:hypothetical protein
VVVCALVPAEGSNRFVEVQRGVRRIFKKLEFASITAAVPRWPGSGTWHIDQGEGDARAEAVRLQTAMCKIPCRDSPSSRFAL